MGEKMEYKPFSNLGQAVRAGFKDLVQFQDDEVGIREKTGFIPIEEIAADPSCEPQNILIAAEDERENGWSGGEFVEDDAIKEKIRNFEKELKNEKLAYDVVDVFLNDIENKVKKLEMSALDLLCEIKEKKKRDKKQRRAIIGKSRGKRGKEPWWKNKGRMSTEKKFALSKQSAEFFENQ